MNEKITIAIDGLSSTGKSTIAKKIAKRLGYIHIDSGAMYRAVTLYAIQHDFISNHYFESDKLIADLDKIFLDFQYNDILEFHEIFLNGINVEKQIRTLEVSKLVSKVSTVSKVREKLVTEQQAMGKNRGIVMDGRDIGTVVFPEAELKLFITATSDKRAKRRYKELLNKGEKILYSQVLENVIERDKIDATRKNSPLKKAVDAIEFDNSNMSLDEQFKEVISLIEKKLQ